MFGYERLWGRLTQWMLQTSHPEATMLNAFKAFKTATTAAPDLLSNVLTDEVALHHKDVCHYPLCQKVKFAWSGFVCWHNGANLTS